jgi:hypothetical protein
MRISVASGEAKAQFRNTGDGWVKRLKKGPKNANDHQQQARVHPAQPSYSVVVPAPELSSIDVAVTSQIAMIFALRKGTLAGARAAY